MKLLCSIVLIYLVLLLLQPLQWCCVDCVHGRNLVGYTGDVSPHFFRWGDIICHVPPLFSLRVCIWRGFKTKGDVCHVLCEEFFILDVTHIAMLMLKEFGVVSLILIFL